MMRLQQIPFLAAAVSCMLLGISSAADEKSSTSAALTGESLSSAITRRPTTIFGLSIGSTKPTSTPSASAGSSANKIIAVVVGSPNRNKSLAFTPNEITANPGDIIQFQFSQINHTVTQSTFAEPCLPIQESDLSAAGIHSGFVAVSGNETTVQTFDVPINDTKPMFIYCAQGPHCQLGMVMTINANRTENFATYKAAAAKAAKNVPANKFKGGVLGSIPKAIAASPPV